MMHGAFALAVCRGIGGAAGGLGPERHPVDHQHAAGGTEVVRIELSEPLAPCPAASRSRRRRASRSTCPASATRSGATAVEINQGNLRSVATSRRRVSARAPRAQPQTRPTNYRAELQGKALVLVLAGSGRDAWRSRPPPGEPVRFAEPGTASSSRCGHRLPPRADGAGRVVVELRQQPGRRRHPPAGPEPGGRVPALHAARQPARVSTSPTSARRCRPSPPSQSG